MKWIAPLLAVSMCGCWYWGQPGYSEVARAPSSAWSDRECLTVLFGAQNNNYLDYRTNIKVLGIPYYPSVCKALGRRSQRKNGWSEEQFRAYMDGLLKQGSGTFVDWEHPGEVVFDGNLDRLESITQFDSLLFIVRMKNIAMGRNTDPGTIDLSDLRSRISLRNERGEGLPSAYVSGRERSYLTNIDETIFVMFRFRDGDRHFLENSSKYYLVLRGFESEIRLEYPALLMR